MSPGDKALEAIISAITTALAVQPDPRLARLQREAISMRSPQMVEQMEIERGLAEKRRRAIQYANHRTSGWRGR